MNRKRPHEGGDLRDEQRALSRTIGEPSEVRPFSSCRSSIDEVDVKSMDASDFFSRFISKRRPCVINGLPSGGEKRHVLDQEILQKTVGNCQVEVEKRDHIGRSFGQNRSRDSTTIMSFQELLAKLSNPSDRELFYLSTQRGKIHEEFMGTLVKDGVVPPTLNLSGNLKLESINLWMGGASSSKSYNNQGNSSSSSSSGLHHDFHDNFYVLHMGRKRFFLFPPTSPIPVYGEIEKIHFNGLISYAPNPTRADGVPLEMLLEEEEEKRDNDDDNQEASDEESEEAVIGKGFDYVSSDEEEATDDNVEDVVAALKNNVDYSSDGEEKDEQETTSSQNLTKDDSRASHFSTIDNFPPDGNLASINPKLQNAKPLVVELKAGQSLFLPASWFHCVFSSSTEQHSVHLAVNYWFHPPDNLQNFSQPYKDHKYWDQVSDCV